MKKSIVFYLIGLLISCYPVTIDQNPEGVYTCSYEHEFAKTEDTLILKKINVPGYFQLVRHSGVIKKADDTLSLKQIITEVWKLEYDNDRKLLTEMKTGKTLIWNADKQILIFGNREYAKSNK